MRIILLLVLSSFLPVAAAEPAAVDFLQPGPGGYQTAPQALPQDVDQFLALRERIGDTPEGGAALLAYALMVRARNPAIGAPMTLLALSGDLLMATRYQPVYQGYKFTSSADYLLQQIDKSPRCMRGFAAGAEPANGYRMDPAAVVLRFRQQERFVPDTASGRAKVFLCNGGTSSCRPLGLKRNSKGIWKVSEFSTLATGCAPVPQADPADEL